MIHFTTQFDPATGLWQFRIETESGGYWSRPMNAQGLERVAKFFYAKRLSEGKGTANQFAVATQSICDLIESGAVGVTKVAPSHPTLQRAAAQKARISQELNRIKLRSLDVDDLLEELGL